MPRRNSAKTQSALSEPSGEQGEPPGGQHEGDKKQNVRSLEALFQAATSELQHMDKQEGAEGQGASQGEEEGDLERTQMVEVDSTTGIIRIQSADGSLHQLHHQPEVTPASVNKGSSLVEMTKVEVSPSADARSPRSPSPPLSPGVTPIHPIPVPAGGRKRKHPQKPGKYVCSYCGRGCAKPSVLEKHLRAHTGERPYPCQPCGFAFKTKSNLYKHCKSRSHHLRLAGISSDQIDRMDEEESDNEDIEPSVVELVVPETPLEKDKKKDMKYYIVEVKEGDSLEEVVKKARLAAGSEKIESITQRRVAEQQEAASGDTMVIEPEMVGSMSEAEKYDEDGWTAVEEMEVGHDTVSADEVTIVAHSTQRVSDDTVKLEFQLAPNSTSNESSQQQQQQQQQHQIETTDTGTSQTYTHHQSFSIHQAISQSQSQPTYVTIKPLPESPSKDVKNIITSSDITRSSVHLQPKSLNPKLSSVALGAHRVTLPKPMTLHQAPKTPGSAGVGFGGAGASPGAGSLTPEMLTARISELITKNQAIVNTPMADAPRPKRMSRQASENLQRSASLNSASVAASVAASSVPTTPASAPVSSMRMNNSGGGGRQLFIQGADGKMTRLLIQDDVLNVSDTSTALPSTPGVLTVTSTPQLTHQISLPVTPTIATPMTPSGDNVIRQLLLKDPPLSQAPPPQATPPELGGEGGQGGAGIGYLCTPCSLLFPTHEAHSMHTKYQCPNSKQSSIDQNEAVLAQIGQQLEAQARNSPLVVNIQQQQPQKPQKPQENFRAATSTGSGTPLLLDIVDPEQPPKRGRPKGVKSRTPSEIINLAPKAPPAEMSHIMGKINLNIERNIERQDSSSSGGKQKTRPNLRLTMPPQGSSSHNIPIAPQTAPVKASNTPHTPLPDWKARLKDKLLKRSMSVEKLAVDKDKTEVVVTSPGRSQTAQVVVNVTERAPRPLIIARPPLKRQASVGEEPEPDRKRQKSVDENEENEAPDQLVIESEETTPEPKEDNVDITLDEDTNLMKIVNYDSGKSMTVPFRGLSDNILANILQTNDIELNPSELPPNNAVWDKLTNIIGTYAHIPKTRPTKLPILTLSSVAAQKIPGLLPNPVKITLAATTTTTTETSTKSTFATIALSGGGLANFTPSFTPLTTTITPSPPSPPSESYPIPISLQDKPNVVYLLLGHSYPVLVADTATTFCSLLKPQPMYVEVGSTNNKDSNAPKQVSMYSNWRTAAAPRLPLGLEIRQLLGLHRTQLHPSSSSDFSDFSPTPIVVQAGGRQVHITTPTPSQYWKDRHPGEGDVHPGATTGVESGDAGVEHSNELKTATMVEEMSTDDQEVIVIDSELLEQAHKVEMAQSAVSGRHGTSQHQSHYSIAEVIVTPDNKESSRIRVCKGGYRTDEDYVYVRGRGRGRYVCEECGIRCKKPSMLRKHIHTHTDLRPFMCIHCRFAFKTKGNLTKHMKSKAHSKRCTELGIVPVPTTVDDPSTDTQAMQRLQQQQENVMVMAPPDEGEEDDDEDKFWMVQDQQFAEMDAQDAEGGEDEEEEEEEGEEVVEEMVIDDEEMQLVEVMPKQQQSGMVKAGKSSDPFYIAVQTSTGEQPVFVKIAPKPQRLLEGEVAASLLDLSQTTSAAGGTGSTSQKPLSPTDTASGDDSSKNDHRLSSLVSALKSRTTDSSPSTTQLQDGRLEQQKVVHLMRLAAADTTMDTTSSNQNKSTPYDSTGFVPPLLQTPLRLATSIAQPPTASETSQSFPDINVKKEHLSPKKSLSNAPISSIKQENTSSSPLLVIKLPEKNVSEIRSEKVIGTVRDGSGSGGGVEKQTKVQPLVTIDLPLSLADNTNDGLTIQEEEEAMEETEHRDNEDDDVEGSLYIKQEDGMLTSTSDPIATSADPIATSVDPMLTGVAGRKRSGPVVINLPSLPSVTSVPSVPSVSSTRSGSVVITLPSMHVSSSISSTISSSISSAVSSSVSSSISSLVSSAVTPSVSSSVTSSISSSPISSSSSTPSVITPVTTSATSDQGPVQVITLPNGQTLSIPVSVLNLHGSPAVVPSQIPLGVRMVTTASTTQQNQTVVRIISAPSSSTTTTTSSSPSSAGHRLRDGPVEIEPIPLKVTEEGPNGKFQCDVCGSEFPRQTQLAAHKNSHVFERGFRCAPCGLGFKSRGVLERHQRTDSHRTHAQLRREYPLPGSAGTSKDGDGEDDDPRPYKCSACSVAFRIHGHLSKHVRSRAHVLRLEEGGAVPGGTWATLDRLNPGGAPTRAVVATDEDSARDSLLALLARKLGVDVNEVDPACEVSFDKSGKPVLMPSQERAEAIANMEAAEDSAMDTESTTTTATATTTTTTVINLPEPTPSEVIKNPIKPVQVVLRPTYRAPPTQSPIAVSTLGSTSTLTPTPTSYAPVKVVMSSSTTSVGSNYFKVPAGGLVRAPSQTIRLSSSGANFVQVAGSTTGNLVQVAGSTTGNLVHVAGSTTGNFVQSGGNLVRMAGSSTGNLVHVSGSTTGNLVHVAGSTTGNLLQSGGSLVRMAGSSTGNLVRVAGSSTANLVKAVSSSAVALSSATSHTSSAPLTINLATSQASSAPLTFNLANTQVMLQPKAAVTESPPTAPSIFMCSVCNATFPSVQDTLTHLSQHNEQDGGS